MSKNVKEILESISNDILNDQIKKQLSESFEKAVETKVTEKIQLEVANELKKMDEDHTSKMQRFIEAVDADHSKKFEMAIKKLDGAHTEKLQKIAEKYDKELKEGAQTLREELAVKISNFLDIYLEKAIPATHIKEAVENIRARKLVDEIKKIVSVDEEFISENFKTALKDGHSTIEKLREDVNLKIKENMDLFQEINKTKSALLIEQKTNGLSKDKKEYVIRLLEGKKPEEVESNFSYVMEMFEKDEAEKREFLTEKVAKKSSTLNKKIDVPLSTIKESIQPKNESEVDNSINLYVEELKKQVG